MGRGKSKKELRQYKIANAIDDGVVDIDELAVIGDCTTGKVLSDMKELTVRKQNSVTTKTRDEIIDNAHTNYQRMMGEAINISKTASSTGDKCMTLDQQRKLQEAHDKLMKMCGIYVEKSEHLVTIQDIRETPQYKQFIGLFEEWCMTKGLDITDFFKFVDRRTRGTRKEVTKMAKDEAIEVEGVEENE